MALKKGEVVVHSETWKTGTIIGVRKDKIKVLFESGEKEWIKESLVKKLLLES